MSPTGEVLVIERDSSIRQLIEAVVRMIPRRPVGTGDGRSAVALLSAHSYDALVLDLLQPDPGGADILEFVNDHEPKLLSRTIIVTTLPESRWADIAHTRSCAAVLRKPFSLDELRTVLHACCGSSA